MSSMCPRWPAAAEARLGIRQRVKTWLLYLGVSWLTSSPLLGILAVAAVWLAGGSWWVGRLPDVLGPWRQFQRVRKLRDANALNPHDLVVRTELAGLVATREPEVAEKLLGEVLRRYPDNELAHYHRGRALLARGQIDEGRAEVLEALRLRRDLRWGEPGVVLGDALMGARRPAEALSAYLLATGVHGSFAEAWFKAGAAGSAAGQPAEARRCWELALSTSVGAPPYKRRQDRLWRWRAWLALRRG